MAESRVQSTDNRVQMKEYRYFSSLLFALCSLSLALRSAQAFFCYAENHYAR